MIDGGGGNDKITGAGGADYMTGGGGFDTFVYNSVNDSPPGFLSHDHITDFVGNGQAAGDLIDLTTIDANSNTPAINDAFGWSAGGVPVAHQVWYNAALDLLQGDTNGISATVEFEVHFLNNPIVTQFDVIL